MRRALTAVSALTLAALLTSCSAGAATGEVVELPRPDGGTVECAVISGGTRMAGIDCNWPEAHP